MKNKTTTIAAAVLTFLLVVLPLLGLCEVVDRIVAIVNDDVITLSELVERRKKYLSERGMSFEQIPQDMREKLTEEVLDMIILDRLTEQEVKRYHIMVPKKAVDREIERIKEKNLFSDEDLEKHLAKQGLTYEEFRKKVTDDLKRNFLIERLLKSKTVISDEQVKEYYEEHRAEFVGQVARHIKLIFLPYETSRKETIEFAKTLHKRLQEGEDFGGLAKIYSQGPAASEGGDLGLIKVSNLKDELKDATSKMRPGEVSPPIEAPEGVYILKLVGVKLVGHRPFAEVKENIRWRLKNKETEKRFDVWYEELKARAYIKKML